MTEILQNALILMTLLQLKHMFADYFMQTPAMLSARGKYLHIGRVAHAAIHSAGSALAFAVMGIAVLPMLVIVLIEGVVHFHIDWLKGRYSDKTGDTPTDAGYWRAFGVDQFLHQVTYVVMLWAWVVYAL